MHYFTNKNSCHLDMVASVGPRRPTNFLSNILDVPGTYFTIVLNLLRIFLKFLNNLKLFKNLSYKNKYQLIPK